MTAVPAGSRSPSTVLGRDGVRRLALCIGVALLVAVMTGPSGNADAPTSGITGSLGSLRAVWFALAGAVVWGLFSVRDRFQGRPPMLGRFGRGLADVDLRLRYTAYVALLAVACALPLLVNGFWQEVLVGQIGIFVLLAVGLNVVVGFAGLLDLGYIAFYAIGAYSAAYFTGSLPAQPPFTLNPFLAFPIAILAAMIAGVVLGAPTLRLRGDYLAIVTLGFGEIIQIVANNLKSVGGPQGVVKAVPEFSIHAGGLDYQWPLALINEVPWYYLLLGIVVLVLVLFHLLENSRVGRIWVAIREDEVAAQACGINTLRYKVLAFAIGASTSGVAGVFVASKNGTFTPGDFTVQASILVLVLVIFGGMGSIPGAVVGAAVLQWLPQALRGHIEQQDLYIYYGALLVAMMIFRPQGLLPSRRRSRELGMAEEGVSRADAVTASAVAP